MSKPSSLVDHVFTRLTLRYGRDFMDRYVGLDTAAVKAEWVCDLAGLSAASLQYALDNLAPGRPPYPADMRAIASRYRPPEPERPALPAPAVDRQRVRELLAEARASMCTSRLLHPSAWAHDLLQRELAGEKRLTFQQREMAMQALARCPMPIEVSE